MSYIKQNVQGSYESAINERNKSYLLALKDFLIGNGFTFVSENYATTNQENITMNYGNTQYYFRTSGGSSASTSNDCTLYIIVSKMLDNGTVQAVTSGVSISLQTLKSTNAYASGSTVLLVKNQNSFALVITSSANSVTSSNNAITGNIAYKLLNDTNSDISFVVNSTTFTAIEKSQGNSVTFRLAHSRLNDDRLVYENKVSINQNGFFVGESNEIIGLASAEKGKIYQTEKGKYFAFANDIAMLMGDEVL